MGMLLGLIKQITCRGRGLAISFLLLTSVMKANTAFAVLLVVPHMNYGVQSFRPLAVEDVNSYYTPGIGGSVGYLSGGILHLAFCIEQSIGSMSQRLTGKKVMRSAFIGGEGGFLVGKWFYLGGRFGQGYYKLLRAAEPGDVDGHWQGRQYGVSVGVNFPTKGARNRSWRVTLGFNAGAFNRDDLATGNEEFGERKFDAFRITASYVYNTRRKIGMFDFFASSLFK
jgi:hypothetical protein